MHLFMQTSPTKVSAINVLKIRQTVIPDKNKQTDQQTKQTKKRNACASI